MEFKKPGGSARLFLFVIIKNRHVIWSIQIAIVVVNNIYDCGCNHGKVCSVVLRALRFRASIAVFVFSIPAVFLFSVAWRGEWLAYLPFLFFFGMASLYALPLILPETEIQLNDTDIVADGLRIPLDRIDYFYEDAGCITVVSKDKIGGYIFRNYIRLIHRELFIYKGMAGEAKEISTYLTSKNLRKKSSLWRRFPYYLAF